MQQSRKAHILHYDSVHPESIDIITIVERSRQLAVRYESIDSHIYFYAVGMRIINSIRKLLITEIVSENPGIECHASHVNCICSVIDCGNQMSFASHR